MSRAVQAAKITRHGIVFGGIVLGLLFVLIGLAYKTGFMLLVGLIFIAGGVYQQFASDE